ncbi:MAG: glycosyltransferase family 2 protein [Anaerolineales bacterium]|nr:glycosyltransferase family 2 protein [Anaerolineales bacterium]
MTDLAIIIVSWNTRALTLDAIRTLREDLNANGPQQSQIWVVDNDSSDDSAAAIRAEFPDVHLLESKRNLGFAGGNNLAIREIGFGKQTPIDQLPKAVYLLNSDTRTHLGATYTLYNTLLEIPDAGVVGARLTYEDGSFQHSAFEFPGLKQLWVDLFPIPARLYHTQFFNGRYPQTFYQSYRPFRVGHTLGATMMLRREVIQQTGMFDESYFMYAEEVDWSWRIQKAGWKIYCVPAAHVTHLEGQSTKQVKPTSILNLWKSRFLMYDRHYTIWKRFIAKRMVKAGMRFKIRDAHRAYAAKQISAKERDMLIEAYQQVQHL